MSRKSFRYDIEDTPKFAPGPFTGKRVLITTLGAVGKALGRRDDGFYSVWFVDLEKSEPPRGQKTIWAHESELETTGLPMSWPGDESAQIDKPFIEDNATNAG